MDVKDFSLRGNKFYHILNAQLTFDLMLQAADLMDCCNLVTAHLFIEVGCRELICGLSCIVIREYS